MKKWCKLAGGVRAGGRRNTNGRKTSPTCIQDTYQILKNHVTDIVSATLQINHRVQSRIQLQALAALLHWTESLIPTEERPVRPQSRYYYYYYYLLQLCCHPVAEVILHVYRI